jgi:hypothetical protein
MDELSNWISNIEKEEKWLKDDVWGKEIKLKDIALTIRESEESYEWLGGHVD